jgi:hypothetical protein
MVEDDGGFVVPQEDKDNPIQWFRFTMDGHGQEILARLLVMRRAFYAVGAGNEECTEYVLSVLDYILGETQDNPTADWIINPPP